MLKEITINNFKSINNELVFSLEADTSRVSEYPEHILKVGDQELLKVTSMYGPNGGGKTNILLAVLTAKKIFLNGENSTLNPQQISCVFNDSDIVEETLFFVTEKYEIGYQFKIKPVLEYMDPVFGVSQKMYYSSYDIIEENVNYRKVNDDEFNILFSRDSEGNVISDQLKEIGVLDNLKLAKNKSVINYIFTTFANNNSELQECLEIIRCLSLELLSINDLGFNKFQINNAILDIIENNKSKLVSLLNDVDIKIKDIKIYREGKFYPIFFLRELSKEKKIEKEISLSEESAGTQKIFWILVNILNSINKQNIFICDDMNALLHPKLFREVVKLFNSKDNKTSQLIFNSHDIINMDSELFRRDEIWFVYRDDEYSTNAVPLSNILNYKGEQVRKDAKYSKQYLEGKYGADPFIKKGLNWYE